MSGPRLMQARDLVVRRGSVTVLQGAWLDAAAGEIVAVTGPNGSGKSTLLETLAGLVPARRGSFVLGGRAVLGRSPQWLLRAGLALVPQGRRVFPGLSARRNLELGGTVVRDRKAVSDRVEAFFRRFPLVGERADVPAGSLSGGEQGVLALGRALVATPSALLLDEPLMGMAAGLRVQVLDHLRGLAAAGTAVVVIDHDRPALASVATRMLEVVDGHVHEVAVG